MKTKGFQTNAIKPTAQAGPKATTTAVSASLAAKGKKAPVAAIKPKQKSMPMAAGKKLGNHF